MIENSTPSIQIDLNEFKLHIYFKNRTPLTLHFSTPSRKFYLSLIALVLWETKKTGKIKTIPMKDHLDLLALFNETIGGGAGSSNQASLLHRIYTKWKEALPNIEEAPLFKVLGRKKEEGIGTLGRGYSLTEAEKNGWANLFEYVGSEENVRLKFALDRIGVGLDEASIIFGDFRNEEAWEQFIAGLKKGIQKKSDIVKESAVPESASFPSLPNKPSIAVLPFVNMSEDPKLESLCDGLSEVIIAVLTKIPELFVIARNSTFTYKGKPVKVKQVSEELGVRYVLEGSIQKSGDRFRITPQLIDALTENHIWAERYDRELQDLFAMQDEIALKILKALQVKITRGEQSFITNKWHCSENLECYLKFMEAYDHMVLSTVEDNKLAWRKAEEVLAMCPGHT